jgi:hypothetical protein
MSIDQITQKVNKVIPGITKNQFGYIDPLNFYMYVDEIDPNNNYYNGEKSTLMAIIPVTAKEFGDIIYYEPRNLTKITSGVSNSMYITIKDNNGEKYVGDFIADFTLN